MKTVNERHAMKLGTVQGWEKRFRYSTYEKRMKEYNPYHFGFIKKSEGRIEKDKINIDKEAASEFLKYAGHPDSYYSIRVKDLCKFTKLKMQVIRNAKAVGVPQNQIEY